jgi:hypothetical protein
LAPLAVPICTRAVIHLIGRDVSLRSRKGVRENVMFPRDAVHPSERFMAAKRKAHDQLFRKRLELRSGVWEFYTNECGKS